MIRKFIRKVRHWFRSAISGRFVSEEYARDHPESTIEERRNA